MGIMGRACDQLFMAMCLLVIEVFVRKAYEVVSDPVTLVKHCPSKQRERYSINMATGISQLVAVSSKGRSVHFSECAGEEIDANMSFRKIIIVFVPSRSIKDDHERNLSKNVMQTRLQKTFNCCNFVTRDFDYLQSFKNYQQN